MPIKIDILQTELDQDAPHWLKKGQRAMTVEERKATPRYTREMRAALKADGEKLRAMTGEEHGPFDVPVDGPDDVDRLAREGTPGRVK
jgi:hypothetical protein